VEGGFSQCRLALGVDLTVVLVLLLDGSEISDGGVQPVLVEPVHPGQCLKLELVGVPERAVDLHALGLVEPDPAGH
jgi:hypothetical protein